jgi:hypothetical protein
MVGVQSGHFARIFIWAVALVLIVSIQSSARAENARAENAETADNAYLNALNGEWTMTGTLLGKPVRYDAHAERVLQGGFLRLHMIDIGAEPRYEADVFIGYDALAKDYIAHWLDRFGAAGARVVAIGTRRGKRLVLHFPYSDGAFRDTFTFDARSATWTLLIESQAKDKTWSEFASYTLARPGIVK